MFKYVEQMRKMAFQRMYKLFGSRSGKTIKYDAYPLKNLIRLLCFADEEDEPMNRLNPRKMAIIEKKVLGLTRLAICRGDLSRMCATLPHHPVIRRQPSVSLPSPPKTSMRSNLSDFVTDYTKEEETKKLKKIRRRKKLLQKKKHVKFYSKQQLLQYCRW